ncbi:MAG: TetR/AcrR family transcriptional regulator of autoinduction and epiphytic fitness [Pseudohongiellaceae bacterium]|jgi:TetR/AcrR family transcriptional regulator of autoinduction and epiphytic fitness
MKTFVRKKPNLARKRDPELKTVLILNAARELFAAQGYENTPTAQIAETANVSEGALFHQFPTKRDLFFRLAEDYGRECAAAVMPLEHNNVTPESIVRAAFEFAEENPKLFRFFSTVGPRLDQHDETPMGNSIVWVIRELIERAIENGKVRQCNPQIMAELQYAIVLQAYNSWQKSGVNANKEEYILEAAQLMVISK